jgi:MFS family permease
MRRKWMAAFIVSSFTFISPVSSSMVAPASDIIAQQFGITSTVIIAMTISIFILAYGVMLCSFHGALVTKTTSMKLSVHYFWDLWAKFMDDREYCNWPIYGISVSFHSVVLSSQFSRVRYGSAWNLGCGFAQNTGQLIAFRFLSGLGGSAPLSIGGGVLGDCFRPEERGKAIAVYSLAPLLGPVMGPICGAWYVFNTSMAGSNF